MSFVRHALGKSATTLV